MKLNNNINKIKKALQDRGCLCEVKEGNIVINNCEYYSTLTILELLSMLKGFKVIVDIQEIPLDKRKNQAPIGKK